MYFFRFSKFPQINCAFFLRKAKCSNKAMKNRDDWIIISEWNGNVISVFVSYSQNGGRQKDRRRRRLSSKNTTNSIALLGATSLQRCADILLFISSAIASSISFLFINALLVELSLMHFVKYSWNVSFPSGELACLSPGRFRDRNWLAEWPSS